MSAQLACLYCIACETLHNEKSIVQSNIFGDPVRFRDNIIMVILNDISIREVLYLFKSIYLLEFTKEQLTADVFKCLEMEVQLLFNTNTERFLGTVHTIA